MYGKEKTGLRRLWDCSKLAFAAAIVAVAASLGHLVAAYLHFLPGFADMKPFTFLAYTVIRWLLLSMPAYLLFAYLEDHYATERNRRFVFTAGISLGLIVLLLVMNGGSYIAGFVSGKPDQLFYSIALTVLLFLPVSGGVCLLRSWKPWPVWVVSGVTGAAMVTLAVLSLIRGSTANFVMALSYVALCAAYSLALPKILSYVPIEEEDEEDDHPAEAAIMKDEE